jgi:hypothetical protein
MNQSHDSGESFCEVCDGWCDTCGTNEVVEIFEPLAGLSDLRCKRCTQTRVSVSLTFDAAMFHSEFLDTFVGVPVRVVSAPCPNCGGATAGILRDNWIYCSDEGHRNSFNRLCLAAITNQAFGCLVCHCSYFDIPCAQVVALEAHNES